MAHERLNVPEIARRLGRPEATVRRWSKQFHEFLPHYKRKRRLVYAPESLRLFAFIGELFDNGATLQQAIEIVREKHEEILSGIEGNESASIQTKLPILDEGDEKFVDLVARLADLWKNHATGLEQMSQSVRDTDPVLYSGYIGEKNTYLRCSEELGRLIERYRERPKVVRFNRRRMETQKAYRRAIAR